MQRVVIVGAGGHAQVVADILLRARDTGEAVCPLGYVDNNPQLFGTLLLGLPVFGGVEDLFSLPHDAVIVAIGDNHVRRRVYEQLRRHGEQFVIAKHPRAIVAPDVLIGAGTTICAGAIVNPGSVIGANVILNTASSVDHHNLVGDHAHVAPGVHLGGDVVLGDGALVGIGATVMPQRRVGAWSIVGAGALVHRDVPEQVVVAGVPGTIVKQRKEG